MTQDTGTRSRQAKGIRSPLFALDPPPPITPAMASERRLHTRAPFHVHDRRRPTWKDFVTVVALAWVAAVVVQASGLLP